MRIFLEMLVCSRIECSRLTHMIFYFWICPFWIEPGRVLADHSPECSWKYAFCVGSMNWIEHTHSEQRYPCYFYPTRWVCEWHGDMHTHTLAHVEWKPVSKRTQSRKYKFNCRSLFGILFNKRIVAFFTGRNGVIHMHAQGDNEFMHICWRR